MPEFEKILDGTVSIDNYSLEKDFDNNEIKQLLDAGVIKATDIKQSRASDLLIDGVIDYSQYPFVRFSVFEQLRQLEHNAISPEEFMEQADWDAFDNDDMADLKAILEEQGVDLSPDPLDQAIYDKSGERVIYAIAENYALSDPESISYLEDECFSDEMIFAVLLNAISEEQLNSIASGASEAGTRLHKLAADILVPLPQKPSEAEKKLIRAVVNGDNDEIIRQVREEKAMFYGFAPELLIMLPELSKAASLTLLRDGLSAKLKAIVFGILLLESENPELLDNVSYDDRIKYANLMIQIMAGKDVSPDEPWYPEDATPVIE